jgi:hypothetical protein
MGSESDLASRAHDEAIGEAVEEMDVAIYIYGGRDDEVRADAEATRTL